MIRGLPEKLREERRKTGKSQSEVAEAVGSTKAKLSKYETGTITPPTEILLKLAGYYQVSVDYLLDIKKENLLNINDLKPDDIDAVKTIARAFYKYKDTDYI